MLIEFRFNEWAAIDVVPVPANGSKIVSPSLLLLIIARFISSIGFTVGWLYLRRSFAVIGAVKIVAALAFDVGFKYAPFSLNKSRYSLSGR